MSWTRGKHSLAFGADLRRVQADLNSDSVANGSPQVTGQLTGNAFADMLLGYDASDSGGTPSRQRLRGFFQSYFAQDDLRLSRRFTLNLGVRWDPYNPWVEADDKLKEFSISAFHAGTVSQRFPNAPPGLLFIGDPGILRSIIPARYKDFAPRLGFAYSPSASGRTSIRGGYGIFYDQQVEPIMLQREQNDAPYSFSVGLHGVPFSDPFQGNPDPVASFKLPPSRD
jgi:outer membrane receptor protein involved in Fe transport